MKKIAVLGAGLIGSAIARELGREYEVTAFDINEMNLRKLKGSNVLVNNTNISDKKELQKAIYNKDLVVGALPGFLGFKVLKEVILTGKDIIDISFFPENPFQLDALAKKMQVTAIVDFGVAPGMDNVLLAYHDKKMQVENFICMVGGLPVKRVKPFEYKAPFSAADVLEEYTRPARLKVNRKIIEIPALSDCEYIEFERLGTLEAFNTDGLRTLLYTMPHIPNMKEMTLRYPGHAKLMRIFRESGFFSKKAVNVKGKKIVPIDFTSELLFPIWKHGENEDEYTVMRVIIEGIEAGKNKKYIYNLLDHNDKLNGISSMARTTGFACIAAAKLVLENRFLIKGIIAPEQLGADEKCFEYIMKFMIKKRINYDLKCF